MAKTKKENRNENENNSQEDEELYLPNKETIPLETHTLINTYLCGEITKHTKGYIELELLTEQEMVADSMGLIHSGFIFGAADFAAMAAVNEKNVVLVQSQCSFLSPVKLGDKVFFKASVRQKEGRKRNVMVRGYVHEIKVFEGEFMTVITERHVLKLKLSNEKEESENRN